MDTGTATVVAALIAGCASVAVALITARASQNSRQPPPPRSEESERLADSGSQTPVLAPPPVYSRDWSQTTLTITGIVFGGFALFYGIAALLAPSHATTGRMGTFVIVDLVLIGISALCFYRKRQLRRQQNART